MATDFLTRFDREYLPKLGIRGPTFRAVLREAVHRGARSIVETGCIRKEGNWDGDGQSTLIWADYIKWNTGSFVTIDISQEAIDLLRTICPSAYSICSDSVAALSKHSGGIDLLYLDSFDLDVSNDHPAALHCLFEFCAALPKLHSGSIVFIDDSPTMTGYVVTGKGRYVAAYLRQLDIMPFTWGYQAAWIMP